MRIALALLLCLVPLRLCAEETDYPRAELLVEPTAVAKAPAGSLVLLDARPVEAYRQGHMPGAQSVDVAQWKEAFNAQRNPTTWSKQIGGLGIDGKSTVVVYDDNGSKDAARIWWILRYWGVRDARLLNGGWTGWRAIDGDLEKEIATSPAPKPFQASAQTARLAAKRTVLESLKDKSLQILDTRSAGEFCGTKKLSNARGGAIPGAVHLEWSEMLDPQTQRFLPAAQMWKLLSDAKVDLRQPTATHCQSGGRASVVAFGLELMGADNVQNYYAGWSEWGNAEDTPVTRRDPAAE